MAGFESDQPPDAYTEWVAVDDDLFAAAEGTDRTQCACRWVDRTLSAGCVALSASIIRHGAGPAAAGIRLRPARGHVRHRGTPSSSAHRMRLPRVLLFFSYFLLALEAH